MSLLFYEEKPAAGALGSFGEAVPGRPRGPVPAIDGPKRSGRGVVVSFQGGKGGTGTTTLTLEACSFLAAHGRSVAALELDFKRGDMALRAGVSREDALYTVCDLVPVIRELDRVILDNAMVDSPSGFRVMHGPPPDRGPGTLEPLHVGLLLEASRGFLDFTVIDTGCGSGPLQLEAMVRADVTVLVVTPEASCVAGASALVEMLNDRRDSPRIALVVNRAVPKRDILTPADIEGRLGLTVTAVLRERTAKYRRAANLGAHLWEDPGSTGREIRRTVERIALQ